MVATWYRARAMLVLREQRRDAGGGDGARPAHVAWAKSEGRLRVELAAVPQPAEGRGAADPDLFPSASASL